MLQVVETMSQEIENGAGAAPEQAAPEFNPLAWEQSQYARALKHCTDNGLRVVQLDKRNSRVLSPVVALWLISVSDHADKVWVLTGDLPTDHVTAKVAPKARDALKHFSLSWQLKAQKLVDELNSGRYSLGSPENQAKYASLLVQRAEGMHALTEEERLWARN